MANTGGVGGYTPPSLFPQQASQPEQLQVSPMRAAPIFHPQQRASESPAYRPPAAEEKGLFDRLSKPKSEPRPTAQLFTAQPDLLSLDNPQPKATGLDLISFDAAPPFQSKDLISLEPTRPSPPLVSPNPPPVSSNAQLVSQRVKITHNMAPAPHVIPGPLQAQPPTKGGLSLEALATGLEDLKLESKPKDSKKSDFIIRI